MFKKSKITDMRVFNAFFDFGDDLSCLFKAGYEAEPEYDNFISCFDQGLSEEKIKKDYEFGDVAKFGNGGVASVIGNGKSCADKKRYYRETLTHLLFLFS